MWAEHASKRARDWVNESGPWIGKMSNRCLFFSFVSGFVRK